MGVDIYRLEARAYRPRREIEELKTDVRSKTYVWLCIRRESPTAYHLMGVWVDTNEKSAEELATSQCLDESYYIGPFPVNVALPQKPVPWRGSYCPVKRQRTLERRRLAAKGN